MKTILISLFLIFSYLCSGQSNLNEYKYIIVPTKFEGFKYENQHQTSTIVKHIFTEKGFRAVYDNALPQDLNLNRCLGLRAFLKDDSSMFSTKLRISLQDCSGREIFVTNEGRSRVKEYKEAYREAIRLAMNSFNGINYTYEEKIQDSAPITVSFKNDVKQLEENATDLKMSKASKESQRKLVDKADMKKPKNVNPMVTQEATAENQLYESKEPQVIPINNEEEKGIKKLKIKNLENEDIWYAQALPNGYQLVDSTPKIRMKLLKSSAENVYLAQSNDKSGMVYQKDGKWVFEYYEGDKLIQEDLKIKF